MNQGRTYLSKLPRFRLGPREPFGMVDWTTPGTALEARLSARSSFMIHIISTRRNMIAHPELCANRLFSMLIFGDPELLYV